MIFLKFLFSVTRNFFAGERPWLKTTCPDFSFKYGSQIRLKIEGGTGDVILGDALLSSQEDTDIDTDRDTKIQIERQRYR